MALFETAAVTRILRHADHCTVLFIFVTTLLTLTALFLAIQILQRVLPPTQPTMAEASAADGKMKDLKISETKKKKDGNPQKAAKKPQQQKKKVRNPARTPMRSDMPTRY